MYSHQLFIINDRYDNNIKSVIKYRNYNRNIILKAITLNLNNRHYKI